MRKSNRGITLVALIITIVVLLILALVTINAVRGDEIIGKAQQAKEEYQRKADEENTTLEGYLAFLKENSPGGSSSEGEQENPDNNDSSNEPENTIFEEYVLREASNENSTINGQPYSSTNPIIPAGFKAINTETSKWDAEGGPQVDKGLVISDGNSEFVWVPVTSTIQEYGLETGSIREPDVVTGVSPSSTVNSASGTSYDAVSSNLTLAGCTQDLNGDNTVNAYDFKMQLEKEFEAMTTSVNKYGGFYVGRYETSINSGKAQSVKNAISATAETTSGNTWYGLYKIQKTYNTNSVKSSMIWGSQYDAMMTWMGEAANTTIDGKNITRTTGSVETDKIKNVYDLYGNSYEWTLEADLTFSRASRGSYYNDFAYTPSRRGNIFDPTLTSSIHSSRLTLYIV